MAATKLLYMLYQLCSMFKQFHSPLLLLQIPNILLLPMALYPPPGPPSGLHEGLPANEGSASYLKLGMGRR